MLAEMELLSPERYQETESQDRVKYSLMYFIVRLLHILFYSVFGIWLMGWNYFPLCCGILGTAAQGIASGLAYRWEFIRSPRRLSWMCSSNLLIATALIIDSGLIAMTRRDVQASLLEKVHGMEPMFEPRAAFECVDSDSACKRTVVSESSQTTHVAQFITFYFMMFVLKSLRFSLVVGGLCSIAYWFVSLAAARVSGYEFFIQQDLLFFIVCYAIGVLAKYKMEQTKRILVDVLEQQKEKVVQERVMRCQAEFTYEQVVSQHVANQVGSETYGRGAAAQGNSEGSATAASEAAASAQSAPAVFIEMRQDRIPLCQKEGGDCLPATAVTWVENCPAPRPLNSITPGDRVLCYDNIGRTLTYASIMECHPAQRSETASWVKVTLTDGTQLRMTADHPVSVQPSPEHGPYKQQLMLEMSRQCVRADELTAEQDCLMVLKMVPTPVASIAKFTPESARTVDAPKSCTPEEDWITVTVEQPERHELFVASHNSSGALAPSLAVGSSNRKTQALRGLSLKNTFFHGFEDDVRMPKRSSSAPPSVKAGPTLKQSPVELDPDRTLSGTRSSVSTESPGALDQVDLKVGVTTLDSMDLAPVARFTDFMHSKLTNSSVGSRHKSHDECAPCSFYYTWLRNPGKHRACKLSHMCEYCHDVSHHEKWRSKFRKRRQPQAVMAEKTLPKLILATRV